MNTIFYIAATVAVISTGLVITRAHSVHALLYLIVSLLAVSVIFFVAGAPFIAALEVIIYAGAIIVLFIFVIMMLSVGEDSKIKEKQWLKGKIWIGPGILSAILMGLFLYVLISGSGDALDAKPISPKEVGVSLFSKYLLGVEIAAMLLLAGIIGAYHLGKQEKKVVHRFMKNNNK